MSTTAYRTLSDIYRIVKDTSHCEDRKREIISVKKNPKETQCEQQSKRMAVSIWALSERLTDYIV